MDEGDVNEFWYDLDDHFLFNVEGVGRAVGRPA